jgi:TonB family protein
VRLPLLVSIVLHALAMALLLTIRFPEPPRAHWARVIAISSPYRAPKPVKPTPHLQPLGPPRMMARTFHAPDRPPAPQRLTLLLPDPPLIRSADVRLPESTPPFIEPLPPPVRRVVVTGAFNATISSKPAEAHTQITTGAFGDASAVSPENRARQNTDAAISSAAEILLKPRPAYTEEARTLRIEGEVLLEVLFSASGEARVLRMIRGLGHGLDENAMAAARAIQFRPAKRGDTAADSTAVVHIVFQLAY